MLEKGDDSPSLRILAGLDSEIISPFEIEEYLLESLNELDIPILEEDAAIQSFTYELITEMINHEIEQEDALYLLREISIKTNRPSHLSDFYRLYYAIDGLKYGAESTHWYGATKKNIEKIILETAQEWLEEYKSDQSA